MDYMVYPTFEIVPSRGVLPLVRLPKNYLELVPKFYEQGRKEEIETYAKDLGEMLKQTVKWDLPIRLQFDEKKGLTNINVGFATGFDLDDHHAFHMFCEHNLGTRNGIVAAMIATKYISELLKSG